MFPDKRLRRSLYAFRVRCVHQKSGCEWIGELGELERHLNPNTELGRQFIGCAYAEVACTYCHKYFQRRHVHAHESESCPQRPFSCDYCEDYGSVYEDVVNNHWPVCKWYPVPCPNECGVNPERQNVETHVNTVCPLTVVNCDFHYAGCEVQLVRKDMPTHLAESLATHISLLTTQTQTLAGKGGQDSLLRSLTLLALHNQQLTQLTIQLKESLEESQRKIQELEREKQAQATVTAELLKCSEASKREIETLKLKVNKDVLAEKRQQKKSLEEKLQELEQKRLTGKHEIEALKLKVNENLEQEVAELRRQQDEDRASLVTLQRCIGVLPPVRLTMTNYEKRKKSSDQWYSPPFYTHPQGYKMCLRVYVNGSGGHKGTHVSLYAYLMRGEFDDYLKWPF